MHRRGEGYLEMQTDKGKDETLEVLYEVIKDAQPFRVLTALDFIQRADFVRLEASVSLVTSVRGVSRKGYGEGNVLIAGDNLELLSADAIR